MALLLQLVAWVTANMQPLMASFANLCSALGVVLGFFIAFFLLIPGDQPEKGIKSLADFIAKFSKK